MQTSLTTQAVERSTFVVRVDFTDEYGRPAVPDLAAWTLTNGDGAVINSLSDIPVSPLASSVNIILTGDDLAILGERGREYRQLTVFGNLNGKAFANCCDFWVVNLDAAQ